MIRGFLPWKLACFVVAIIWMGDPVAAESFRVSKVASAEGETTERFELERDGEREVLFVEKQAIVSTADVESARPSPMMAHALEFRLTEQGGEKLHKATKDVVPGVARFAILIDGKLVMAPVLNATLGRDFIVEGLMESGSISMMARSQGGG